MNFCQHNGRWSKKHESSAHDPNMSSGASMGADFSVLLTLPEKPLSSKGYDTHDTIIFKPILSGQWSTKNKKGYKDGVPQTMARVSTFQEIFHRIAMNISKMLMHVHQTSYNSPSRHSYKYISSCKRCHSFLQARLHKDWERRLSQTQI